jgi:hypothetical protein
MKNGINMGQFRVKTGSNINGWKNLSPISVNTETGPHKYGNERTKVKNGTGIFPSVFNANCNLQGVPRQIQ